MTDDEKYYEILKFISEQNRPISNRDFPNNITSNYTAGLDAGSFIDVLYRVLGNDKNWINGAPNSITLTDNGKKALQKLESKKIHVDYVNELQFKGLESNVRDLQNRIDNFKPSNWRANLAIIIAVISMIAALVKGCK